MFERLKWLLPTLSLLLAMSLLSAASREPGSSSVVSRVVLEVVGPVERLLTFSARGVEDFFKNYFFLIGVKKENESLLALIEVQQKQIVQLAEEQKSNIRLTSLLGLRQAYPRIVMKPAHVLAWDPGPWLRSITINVGTDDGVAVNQAVIHNTGVVGRIIEVSPNYARVILATDFHSSIDAVVQRSRVIGILSGLGTPLMDFKYIPKDEDVRLGDLLVTSGLDGFFPRGLALGQVSFVDRKSPDIFTKVEVTPTVEYDRLEEVMVITNQEEPIDWLALAPHLKFREDARRELASKPAPNSAVGVN